VTERQKLGAKLDPALKEWADRVIIPALAREYFAQVAQRVAVPKPFLVSKFSGELGLSAEVTP
jgi:hypothetical protein